MKYKIFLSLLFLSFCIKSFCTDLDTLKTIEGNSFIKPSLSNLKKMFLMSNAEWELALKNGGLGKAGYAHNGLLYSKVSKFESNDGMEFILKNPELVSIWYSLGSNNESIFDYIISELEKFYIGMDNGYSIYKFKFPDGSVYLFQMKLNSDTHEVIIRKG